MSTDPGKVRLRRIKIGIVIISISSAAAFLAFDWTGYTTGILVGGGLILINLLGTERAVGSFLTGGGLGKAASSLIYLGKLGATVAIIAMVLATKIVSTIGLIIGLMTLPVALVVDFLIFPEGRDEDREP